MPVCDFRCRDCGEDFEVDCHMDQREEEAVCPKYGGRNVESVLTAAFSSPRPPKYWPELALRPLRRHRQATGEAWPPSAAAHWGREPSDSERTGSQATTATQATLDHVHIPSWTSRP